MSGAEIRVNVYDLTKANGILRAITSKKTQFGVYHTSVVVGNQFEVYYGFYRNGVTGVDYASTIDKLPSSMKGNLYSSYVLGNSKYSVDEIRTLARKMSLRSEWLSDRYNILQHNCHSFSLAFCKEILQPHQLRLYPGFVFNGENVGNALYDSFISIFVDKEHPPYFLNKQPFSQKSYNENNSWIANSSKYSLLVC